MSEEKEAVKEEAPGQQDLQQTIKTSLFDLPGAPSQEQVDKWKAEFGEVMVSGFSEKELVIWRPIKRKEYLEIQNAVQEGRLGQAKSEEALLDQVVLFSSITESWENTKGGIVPTLVEQIMQGSSFVAASVASMFVVKL